jgi:hypothetical protein
VHQKRNDGADEEYDEQNFGDAGGPCGNSAETEDCGNECDDEKYDSVVEHGIPLVIGMRVVSTASTLRGVLQCSQLSNTAKSVGFGLRTLQSTLRNGLKIDSSDFPAGSA